MKLWIAIVMSALLVQGCAAPSTPAPAPAPSPTPARPPTGLPAVAVLDLEESYDEEEETFAPAVTAQLQKLLKASGKVQVVDPAQVRKAASELKKGPTVDLAVLGKALRARYLLSGTAFSGGMKTLAEGGERFWVAECRVKVTLLDVTTSEVLDATQVTGTARTPMSGPGGLAGLMDRAGEDAVAKIVERLLPKLE